MLDLIVPVYDAFQLDEMLASVAYQTDTDVEVYLIDDCSHINYDEIISFYQSFLSIHYFRLEENSGPGVARQYGIDHSHSPYIAFMDSDDSFSSPYAIHTMKEQISSEYDFMIGSFVEEYNGGIMFHNNDEIWLHGKIYSRHFICSNHIHFNDTRKNEDNFFNQLMFAHQAIIYYFPDCVYIYRNNAMSITRRDYDEYSYEGDIFYAYNVSEALNESLEDGCDKKVVSSLGYNALIALYFYMIELKDRDLSKMIEYTKRIYQCVDFDLLDEEYKERIMKVHLSSIVSNQYQLLLEKGSFYDYLRMLGDSDD